MAAKRFSLGVHVGQQNMPIGDMRAVWRQVDEAGLDWLSCWDHLYEAPPAGGTLDHYEALSILGAMAVETKRVRLGCLVFYVGYRNPALLAKAATTLDHLSGGRFELGLGGGWHEQEALAYGYDFPAVRTRLDMLEEAVPMIRSLLSEPRTTFHGTHFRVEDASCLPAPVNGHLPLWVGGTGMQRTLRIAARWADGWNAAYVGADSYAELIATLDHWCEVEGRDPSAIERTINLTFNLTMDEAGAAREEAKVRESFGPLAARILAGTLLGTPQQAAERVLEYRAAGADGVNVALRAPWDAEAFDTYLNDIVPAIRTAVAS